MKGGGRSVPSSFSLNCVTFGKQTCIHLGYATIEIGGHGHPFTLYLYNFLLKKSINPHLGFPLSIISKSVAAQSQ